jgi:hypothetical protein
MLLPFDLWKKKWKAVYIFLDVGSCLPASKWLEQSLRSTSAEESCAHSEEGMFLFSVGCRVEGYGECACTWSRRGSDGKECLNDHAQQQTSVSGVNWIQRRQEVRRCAMELPYQRKRRERAAAPKRERSGWPRGCCGRASQR